MNKLSLNELQNTQNDTPSNHHEGEFSDNSDKIKTVQNDLYLQKDKDLAKADELKNKLNESDEQSYLDSFLKLDPHTFDQDKEKGRRKDIEINGTKELVKTHGRNTEIMDKGLKVMNYYLHNYPFSDSAEDIGHKQLLEWHIGQIYAMTGNYSEALKYFEKLKREGDTSVGNEYMDATIAFLKRDKASLEKIYKTISSQIDQVLNGGFIDQLYNFFDKSYTEAYAGMNYNEINMKLFSK